MTFSRLLAAAASLALTSVSLADVTYQLDDGAGNVNSGPQAGTPLTIVWGNVFAVQEEAAEITSILVAVGRVPGDAALTARLYEDPNDDGNPDDAVLLTSVDFAPIATASNTFTQIEIPPTRVSGKFFVACSVRSDGTSLPDGRPAYAPVRVDTDTRALGSSAFVYWGPNLDTSTLTGWTNRGQYTNVATMMVRAVGRVPVDPPACPADLGAAGGVHGQDGVLDNNDFIAFIDLFFAADSAADLGTTGGLPGSDRTFDNNDFIAFIDRFFTGCG